jgi:site-specific DNA-methyltransferase (adenine-specific)
MGYDIMELNKNYNLNCLDGLKLLKDESIDMIITSPPYDNLRAYNGYSFDFENIAKELYRVIKDGGVIVWVVGDATVLGSETGTSFRQALYFKSLGFNIHDTMIYEKNSSTFPASEKSKRYTQIFEYMFILSKGTPKTVNLIKDKKNKWYGYKDFSGKLKKEVPEFSPRTNIWKYTTSFDNAYGHPAPFPEKLVEDHILTWTNKNDIVLDIFMGSGTTAKVSIQNGRKWLGFEISKEYCDIIDKRIDGVYEQIDIFSIE